MFCSKCGKELSEGVQFCPNCGTPLNNVNPNNTQPVYTVPFYPPVQPKILPPTSVYCNKIVSIYKGFFSKNTENTIELSAKDTSYSWVAIAVIGILIYGFSCALFFAQIFSSENVSFGSISAALNSYGFGFGKRLLLSLLTAAISFIVAGISTWFLTSVILKKNIMFSAVLNVVSVASIPLSVACFANILIGFVYSPAEICIFITAFVAFTILLYIGIQKLNAFESSIFWAYIALVFIIIALVSFVGYLVLKNMVSSSSGNMFGFNNLLY